MGHFLHCASTQTYGTPENAELEETGLGEHTGDVSGVVGSELEEPCHIPNPST